MFTRIYTPRELALQEVCRQRKGVSLKLEQRRWFSRTLPSTSSLIFLSLPFSFPHLWRGNLVSSGLVASGVLRGKSKHTSVLLADSVSDRCSVKQSDTLTEARDIPFGGATKKLTSLLPAQHSSSWFLQNSLYLGNMKEIFTTYHFNTLSSHNAQGKQGVELVPQETIFFAISRSFWKNFPNELKLPGVCVCLMRTSSLEDNWGALFLCLQGRTFWRGFVPPISDHSFSCKWQETWSKQA